MLNIEQIKQFLMDNHYFLHVDDGNKNLALKIDDNNYRILDHDIKAKILGKEYIMTPLAFLEFKVNATVMTPLEYYNLNDMLSVINFDIFRKYDQRQINIANNLALKKKVQGSVGFFNTKDKIIKLERSTYINGTEVCKFCVIKDGKIVPVAEELVENPMEAVSVLNMGQLKNAISETGVNEYAEEVEKQNQIWSRL